jgi:iron complex outermembrane receptor protein
MLRYVDNLPTIHVDSYTTMDVRLGWRPTRNLEISVGGQNLLEAQHAEFRPSFIGTTIADIERAAYAKLTIRF